MLAAARWLPFWRRSAAGGLVRLPVRHPFVVTNGIRHHHAKLLGVLRWWFMGLKADEHPLVLSNLYRWHHRLSETTLPVDELRHLMGVFARPHGGVDAPRFCGVFLDESRVCTTVPDAPYAVCNAHRAGLLQR